MCIVVYAIYRRRGREGGGGEREREGKRGREREGGRGRERGGWRERERERSGGAETKHLNYYVCAYGKCRLSSFYIFNIEVYLADGIGIPVQMVVV